MLPALRTGFDTLSRKRTSFEAQTRALSEVQLRFRPDEGSWSIAEVAHHLLHVEREITRAASKPGVERRRRRRTAREWVGYLIFLAVVHLHARIKVPEKVAKLVTPSANPDMDQLWLDWTDLHAKLAGYLETVREDDLELMAFRHPIMGPTSVKGMLSFFLSHFDHHMRQVRRIRRSPDFPRA